MPNFEFECAAGHIYEVFLRRMQKKHLCGACLRRGRRLTGKLRITGGSGFILKGDGFYRKGDTKK